MIGNPAADVTGYVLAGGRSSRMGQDKVFVEIDGVPLIQHAVAKLQSVCCDVRILSGPLDINRDALLSSYARPVPDSGPEYDGPLAALAAALRDLPTRYALLLAVDQPRMSVDALAHLVASGVGALALAACYSQNEIPESLPLLVSRELLSPILAALGAGQRRLLDTVRACCADLGQPLLTVSAARFPPEIFLNVNTPGDLKRYSGQTSSNHSARAASENKNG
ncbi:molybdenum cofactor guanylyltransferase [Terriglobus aquaticus]|uniref:Probable molybdenum cofactor guanylyltransferase n=1 Tax=Terriglobus aquaticus TaxID=940139 RepID=A0ABW9KP20_9BACT|nr:molybdenum cofactor guanylyltransferase [Terriglobus aquaticus]